jgi:tetratricopeptide (TPR) repeat protein
LKKFPALMAVITTFWGSPGLAEGFAGPYLAARQADYLGDFETSARYNARLIVLDSSNLPAMESLIVSKIAMGDMEAALEISDTFVKSGATSQMVHLLSIAKAVKANDFDAVLAQLETQKDVGHSLVDGLIKGWASAGAGQIDAAFAQFDELAGDSGLASFGIFHRALLNMVIGDYQSASNILEDLHESSGQTTVRGMRVRIQALMMQGEFKKAEALFKNSFGAKPSLQLLALTNDLKAKRPPQTLLMSEPSDGIAEIFFSVAQILSSEQNDDYTLVHARLAEYLLRERAEATLLSAEVLTNMEQFELATRTFAQVTPDDALFHTAQIGRADALSQNGNHKEAIEVLQELTEIAPDMATAYQALGDDFRSVDRLEDAVVSYSSALDLLERQKASNWTLHYSRGIVYEQLDDWINAEKDFRRALEIKPNQPYVLNYLGYSLVEKQLKLDEALNLIETAVSLRPESGYIVDSFGWVLFRLSRFTEAVPHLEKAAELMPVDPIINDHLGDVYWAVGRKREARFQWSRALSFDSEDVDIIRIRKKLQIGLDNVLIEEGSKPLELSNSDD